MDADETISVAATAERGPRRAADAVADRCVEHRPLLCALARRLTKNAASADDLVQDTIERTLTKGKSVEPEKLRSWMVAVLNNLFIDQCRRRARRPQVSAEVVASLPAPAAAPTEAWHAFDVAALRDAVDELPAEFAEVYRLHAFEKKRYAEIAKLLGVPSATVGTRLLRARKRLKLLLLQQTARAGKEA